MANAVRILREHGRNYILVLPPWGGLYHWNGGHLKVPWAQFFHTESINQFIPAVEFHEFLRGLCHTRVVFKNELTVILNCYA